ncbi:MAG TPA: HAD-IIIA family hydrolase, partial [Trueperaceae bacterium]|nr:HAD-IIIA family hydrolase [Trueperaceae bacterium]
NNLKESGIPLLILSNGSPKRVKYWTQELGLEGFYLVGKPFSFAFKRALKLLNCSAKETAMIGDQVFTDILGANLTGLKSILVRPLSPGGLWHTRILRNIEKLILKGEYNARIINW